jgi:hypothetical protein
VSRRLIVNDGRRERELVLVGTIVVGRDPMCDVSEPDSLLSRRHAEFSIDGKWIVVRDLGSRNGIYVNGARKAETQLRSGDLIQIGNLQLRYVEDASPIVVAPELEDVDATSVIHGAPGSKSRAADSGARQTSTASTSVRPATASGASAPSRYQDDEPTAFVPPRPQQGPAGPSNDSVTLRLPMPADDTDQTSVIPGPGLRQPPGSPSVSASVVATQPPGVSRALNAASPADYDEDQTRVVAPQARPAATNPTPPAPAVVKEAASSREAHALSIAAGAIADFLGGTVSSPKAADVVNMLQQDLALAADGKLGVHENPVRAGAKEIVDELNRLMVRLRTVASDLS